MNERFNYYALTLDSRTSCLIIERFVGYKLVDTDILSGRMDAIACEASAVAKNRQLIREGNHISSELSLAVGDAA